MFLTEEMKVQLQLYDGRALSASLPKHVTCTIEETQLPMKGLTSAPRYVFFFNIRITFHSLHIIDSHIFFVQHCESNTLILEIAGTRELSLIMAPLFR